MQTATSSSATLDTPPTATRRSTSMPTLSHVAPQVYNEPIARVNKGAIHWKRKVFHALGIGVVPVAYASTPVEPMAALAILAAFTVIFAGLDMARFYVPALNRKVRKDFGMLMRDYELEGMSGSSWFLFSSLLCVAMFSKTAASIGFLYLALGDPIASWAGLRWGKTKLPGGKSLEGSLALVGVCTLSGLLFLVATGTGLAIGPALLVAGCAAVAAAFAEWLPIKGVDDNFVVPLVTGAAAAGLLAIV